MYVIVEDLTNQRVYCENAIFIHGTVETLVDAIAAANKAYEKCEKQYYGECNVDTDKYKMLPGARISPYPEYVIGEESEGGWDYHHYFMVIKTNDM